MIQDSEAPRLDKWLWFARFAKTRSVAQTLCTSGHVRVNGDPIRRGHQKVKIGDTIDLVLGHVRRTVTVVGFGFRRGPAPEAQALYDEPNPPSPQRALEDQTVARREAGSGRPSKRERRQRNAMFHGFSD